MHPLLQLWLQNAPTLESNSLTQLLTSAVHCSPASDALHAALRTGHHHVVPLAANCGLLLGGEHVCEAHDGAPVGGLSDWQADACCPRPLDLLLHQLLLGWRSWTGQHRHSLGGHHREAWHRRARRQDHGLPGILPRQLRSRQLLVRHHCTNSLPWCRHQRPLLLLLLLLLGPARQLQGIARPRLHAAAGEQQGDLRGWHSRSLQEQGPILVIS